MGEMRSPQPPNERKLRARNTVRSTKFSMPGGDDDDSDDEALNEDGTPMSSADKLKKVMIKKKDEGIQAIKIFMKFPGFFTGRMTKTEFQKGLSSLTKKFPTAEVLALCSLFGDEEDNKFVSSQKFADFCFSINAMCWKAEKNRNKYKLNDPTAFMLGFKEERPSEIKKKQEEVKKVEAEAKDVGEKGAAGNSKFSAAPELIGTTVKLFWKTNDNLEMHFYSNGSVVSIVPWNTGEHIEYTKVHLDEELVKKALANKDTGGVEAEPEEDDQLEKSLDLDALGLSTTKGGGGLSTR